MVYEALLLDGVWRLMETTTVATTAGLSGSVALGIGLGLVGIVALGVIFVSLYYF